MELQRMPFCMTCWYPTTVIGNHFVCPICERKYIMMIFDHTMIFMEV